MSDAEDLEFELITSVKQLAPAPELRHVEVIIRDWKTATSKKAAKFLVWELTAAGYAQFQEDGRTYKNGVVEKYDVKFEDLRLLAHTLCDPHGNRLWGTVEPAIAQLGTLGRANLTLLLNAAFEVNSVKQEDSEGNSERIPSDSSPTT